MVGSVITISDKTVDPLLVTDGQSIAAYQAVSVTDNAPLSATETVSITLSQTLSQTLGLNYNLYPTAPDLGSISDPNGGGKWNAVTETFTESGVIGGDPNFATTLLHRLQYKAPSLPNGQGFAVQSSITVSNGITTTTDPTSVIVGDVAPPAITGTVADEPIASGDKIPPFATVVLTNPYLSYYYDTITGGYPNYIYTGGPSYSYNANDLATITITDGGKATDADGLLTGPGLSKTGVGTYSLGPNNYYAIQSELRALSFQTVAVAAGQTTHSSFALEVTDSTSKLVTRDDITSLLVIGPSIPIVAPTIAGTLAGQKVVPGNVLDPFVSVTISDTNATPTDSLKITVTNASGVATDANGTLTGVGLSHPSAGVYTLVESSPEALTTKLDALTFHPTGLPDGVTTETTGFTLAATDPAFGKPTTDSKTTVVEAAPPPKLDPTKPVVTQPDQTTDPTTKPVDTPPPQNCFTVSDETTHVTTDVPGDAYVGPVTGVTHEFINVTPHNLNLTAITPNCFIHTGTGDDAINVQAAGGTNVLDGGTGSNFLVGGSGLDTFYADDRGPSADIWSTVVGFHAGDMATIWGLTEADFSVTTWNNLGADGYKGLTFLAQKSGAPNAAVTIAGFSQDDLASGKLTFSYGTVAGSNYLNIVGH